MSYKYNFATGQLDYYQPADLPVVPEVQVFFSTTLPTDVGVVFTPDTPALADTLYISEISGQVFIYKGGAYVTYVSPTPNNTPFYLLGTTIDAGSNKTAMIYRYGAISATAFNTRKAYTSTSASDHNKWWRVFDYNIGTNYTADSFKIQMNEYNTSTGAGKSVIFNILLKRQDLSVILTVDAESGLSSFDLANFDVRYDSTNKRLNFYYRLTTTYTYTNWLVLNARATTTSEIVWYNQLIGASLSGVPNDTITSKTISLNKINGVYTLPAAKATVAGQVLADPLADGNLAWVTSGGGGLTYFTEAQNTSAPNATVNVDSITAIASTANADVAIVPKGAGAFTLAVPDDTIAGGNKRGLNAVDLQTVRTDPSQVASGDGSFIAGGINNKASGINSHAEGSNTTASGEASHTEGQDSVASGLFSHAEGFGAIASGIASHAEGTGTQASGENSHAEGEGSLASGIGSHAEGGGTQSIGDYSHSEGSGTRANGIHSHAEGTQTKAIGNFSHAEGAETTAGWKGFTVDSVVSGLVIINSSYGDLTSFFVNGYVYIFDNSTLNTFKYEVSSVSFTTNTEIQLTDLLVNVGTSICDIVDINNNLADIFSGTRSHSEGNLTKAIGNQSHAEGENTEAVGIASHAEGFNTLASGRRSHAEGQSTTASGDYSHAEGYETVASNFRSHAEGDGTTASGDASHAEGSGTIASGIHSHAEGSSTIANADNSHAEGEGAIASGIASHAEGNYTTASGENSHAEGFQTIASNFFSHAEGVITTASGNGSHAEGRLTLASGGTSHAEGTETTASADSSHAEGMSSIASGDVSHAEGENTTASGNRSHAENYANISAFPNSHAEGINSVSGYGYRKDNTGDYNDITKTITFTNVDITSMFSVGDTIALIDHEASLRIITNTAVIFDVTYTGVNTLIVLTSNLFTNYTHLTVANITKSNAVTGEFTSHVEGRNNIASGLGSHAEGYKNIASGDYSHAEGQSTIASGNMSHSEGITTIASGAFSHSEGESTQASGDYSHAEGQSTIASGRRSHAEGQSTTASGDFGSHAEGYETTSSGESSHAEGNSTVAFGAYSHSEGSSTQANGDYSHAEGVSTTSSGESSHAEGEFTLSTGIASHAEGGNTTASGNYSHAEGNSTISVGTASHAEGFNTTSNGSYSHAEGTYTNAEGESSHAEGGFTTASGSNAHAEGSTTLASGLYSHSEGLQTTASGAASHAEGDTTLASGSTSHAEGFNTTASGDYSHAEGVGTVASGRASHAGGEKSSTKGISSRYSIGSTDEVGGVGTSQLSIGSIVGNTIDATVAEMKAHPIVPIALPLLDNEAIRLKGSILGKQSGSINVVAYDFDCLIVRGVGAGTTVIRMNNMNIVYDDIVLDTVPSLAADTTNGGLSIKSGSKVSTTIKWSARLDSVEVIN